MSNKGLVGALLAIVVIALVVWGAIAFFDVDVTNAGQLPDVDVDVQGGEMPEMDVKSGDIEVEEKRIDLPDSIPVPDIDVKTPEEKATGVNE